MQDYKKRKKYKEDKPAYVDLNKKRVQTVDDWLLILKNERKHKGFNYLDNVLIPAYKEPYHRYYVSELGPKINQLSNALSLRTGEFGKRIKKLLNIETQLTEKGKERWWNIPYCSDIDVNFAETNDKKFCWILRDELIQAMRILIPGLDDVEEPKYEQIHDEKLLEKKLTEVHIPLANPSNKNNTDKLSPSRALSSKPDYIDKAIQNKKIGDTGEELVVRYEKEKLMNAGLNDLAQLVHIVDSDSFGYDIDSYSIAGEPIHIEVKTTSRKGNELRFHLTENERQRMLNDESYYLYFVFDIYNPSESISLRIFNRDEIRKICEEFMRPVQYIVAAEFENNERMNRDEIE